MSDEIKNCPKCKQPARYYVEEWEGHTIEFEIRNGKIEKEGVMNPGDPVKVVALCNCGNKWTVRGVSQISNLRN